MLFGSSFHRSFIRNAQKLTGTLYLVSLFLACWRAPEKCRDLLVVAWRQTLFLRLFGNLFRCRMVVSKCGSKWFRNTMQLTQVVNLMSLSPTQKTRSSQAPNPEEGDNCCLRLFWSLRNHNRVLCIGCFVYRGIKHGGVIEQRIPAFTGTSCGSWHAYDSYKRNPLYIEATNFSEALPTLLTELAWCLPAKQLQCIVLPFLAVVSSGSLSGSGTIVQPATTWCPLPGLTLAAGCSAAVEKGDPPVVGYLDKQTTS